MEQARTECLEGLSLVEQNEHLKGVGAFTKALKLVPAGDPFQPRLLCHRSAALLAINKHAKAHVDAVACTSNFPQHKEGYWCQYKALQALGRYEVVLQSATDNSDCVGRAGS